MKIVCKPKNINTVLQPPRVVCTVRHYRNVDYDMLHRCLAILRRDDSDVKRQTICGDHVESQTAKIQIDVNIHGSLTAVTQGLQDDIKPFACRSLRLIRHCTRN